MLSITAPTPRPYGPAGYAATGAKPSALGPVTGGAVPVGAAVGVPVAAGAPSASGAAVSGSLEQASENSARRHAREPMQERSYRHPPGGQVTRQHAPISSSLLGNFHLILALCFAVQGCGEEAPEQTTCENLDTPD